MHQDTSRIIYIFIRIPFSFFFLQIVSFQAIYDLLPILFVSTAAKNSENGEREQKKP